MNVFRFIVIFTICLAFSFPAVAGTKKAPDRYTVDQLRSRETTAVLLDEARSMIEELNYALIEAREKGDKGEEDDVEDVLEIVEYTEAWLARALRGSSDKEIFSANGYGDRILQTVLTPVEGEVLPPIMEAIQNVVIYGMFGQPMQFLPPRKWEKPMGKRAAEKESANLWSSGRSSFYSSSELAELTPLESSRLDVDPANATWYDRDTFNKLKANRIAGFENYIVEGMTDALQEDDDLEKDRTYPIHQARKVLFMEEVYLSATSAKCVTEDAFGVEWKLKWGDEVAVEPISSRLYLLAGAKMTDLSFASGFGPDALVLVLMDEEDAADKKFKEDERYPATVEELKAHLQEFYEFDLEPYVHSQGTITEANVDSVLKNLPSGGKKKYKKSKVIGRKWVAFRESSVELKTKGFVRRHDGSKLSDVMANNDRAVRGAYLFDMWIGNRDVKDDNNKTFFIKSRQADGDMEITDYREGHHDLGLSLGSLWSSGEVNKMKTGKAFAKKGLFGNKLRFKQAIVFRPKAWDLATWSDSRWMADHLTGISNGQICEAVSSSDWPDFMQEALAWRLINRRDRIGELFGIQAAEISSAPSMTVQLETPEQVRAAERRYGLPAGSLAAEAQGSEMVLKDGVIANCKESAIIRLLVKHRYPSGLNTRYERQASKQPRCIE